MKTLRIFLPLLLLSTVAHATTPKFYITGQVGLFSADAGTVEGAGYYVHRILGEHAIKSGTKSFQDFALGAEFKPWLSLEAGYSHFDSFRSPLMAAYPPNVIPFVPVPDIFMIYRLQQMRLTPVFIFTLTDRLNFKLIGSITYSKNELTQADTFGRTPNTTSIGKLGYQLGGGFAYRLSSAAQIEAKLSYTDLGKAPEGGIATLLRPSFSGNRITALTYSLGLSWRF